MFAWRGRRIYSIIGEHKHLIRIFHIIMLIKRINQAEHVQVSEHSHAQTLRLFTVCDFILFNVYKIILHECMCVRIVYIRVHVTQIVYFCSFLI